MAASEILLKNGTPITVAITAMTAMTTTTATACGVQSAKSADLGATRAQSMLVRLQTKWGAAPTAGTPLSVYVGFSSVSTATSGNAMNLSGADAAYTGNTNDTAQAAGNLQFVGILSASATTASQVKDVGMFTPLDRYVQVVLVNGGTFTFSATSTDHVCTITPLVDEAQ